MLIVNERNGTSASTTGGEMGSKTAWERAVWSVEKIGLPGVALLGMLYLLNRMMDQFPRLETVMTKTSTVMEQMAAELRDHRRYSEHDPEWRAAPRDERGNAAR